MKLLKILLLVVGVALLGACGGGGTPQPDPRNPGSSANAWSLSVVLVDAAGSVLATNAINSSAPFYARATLTSASGASVANRLVSLQTDATVATVAQASALTDAHGVVTVRIIPTSATAANAGRLQASATINEVALSASLDYQTAVANLRLANFKPEQSSIYAFQSTAVTVEGLVNGAPATASPVTVAFSASCGTFSPASASTNGAGVATSVYQATAGCSGVVSLSAQAAGAPAVVASVNVAAALATGLAFSSATETLLVSTGAVGGTKQSTLKFQVLDSTGAAMPGQRVRLALGASSAQAGVRFLVGGLPSSAEQVATSDGSGLVAVVVAAGALPTPVVVTASLEASPTVQASSIGVAVTSGRATQNAASLAVAKPSIEAWEVDGVQTTLSLRVADRQGNPVPAGSAVNFVASHGQVQGTCLLDAASQCSVTYTSQGLRPASGRAVILAYMDGEESFIDQNGDNTWQSGETFYDVGLAYRDDNGNGTYDTAAEQTYPGGSTGAMPCEGAGAGVGAASGIVATSGRYPSVDNTCDGVWSSQIRVRQQTIIVLASHAATVSLLGGRQSSGFNVRVADKNGNAMPTGTTVTAAIVGTSATCTILSVGVVLDKPPGAGEHYVRMDDAADCMSVGVDVMVTTPGGYVTTTNFKGF